MGAEVPAEMRALDTPTLVHQVCDYGGMEVMWWCGARVISAGRSDIRRARAGGRGGLNGKPRACMLLCVSACRGVCLLVS